MLKVTLMMAMTLDGKIGRDSDHFPDWTGSADKKLFAARSRSAGAVIMGSRTFDTIGRPLPDRLNLIMTRNPDRRSSRENLRFTGDAPKKLLADLKAEGYREVILAGGARINTLFAEAGLIDEVVVTVSPLVFGTGLGLFAPGVTMALALRSVERLDKDRVCLTYGVCGSQRGNADAFAEGSP